MSDMSVDDLAHGLKSAMRRMPSAVALITTRDPQSHAPAGLAASAVIPVSMQPPSMLVSINRSGKTHAIIEQVGRFCVNLLGAEQAALIKPFSVEALREQRFTHEAWSERDGLPYLPHAPASIFCTVTTSLIFGTHELFVGEVFDMNVVDGAEPLAWIDGTFARLNQITA